MLIRSIIIVIAWEFLVVSLIVSLIQPTIISNSKVSAFVCFDSIQVFYDWTNDLIFMQ